MKAKGINDRQKLTLLKELAQAMPHEHNLLHHAAVNILKIRESKVNPYELYACFLDSDCSPAAEELFTRLCWNKLVADCPEIGKIINTGRDSSGSIFPSGPGKGTMPHGRLK